MTEEKQSAGKGGTRAKRKPYVRPIEIAIESDVPYVEPGRVDLGIYREALEKMEPGDSFPVVDAKEADYLRRMVRRLDDTGEMDRLNGFMYCDKCADGGYPYRLWCLEQKPEGFMRKRRKTSASDTLGDDTQTEESK